VINGYAVSAKKEGIIIGKLPKKYLELEELFLLYTHFM